MNDFMEILENMTINSRKEAGCLRFDVLQGRANFGEFKFNEVYKDQEAFIEH